ncbi:hypothetical protein P4O66_003496 [Electrophorus voltai]|uniref:Core shell protein Gag P30 domain-containing protein n=1 Tax=Electrophorus voltai TaxID=2609070 RepID=A0AAD9DJJ0_9TELE|nr:hypothetical protein P4O66_003496 [Electrophorus voltai]
MVHRHWTADDIMKAADGLSKPGDIGGRRFGQELMAFVQSCRPTQAELRRLLMIRLGPQYNRIDRNWVDGDVRLHLPEWNAPPQGQPDLNGPYREMIRGLIERVETAYPTTINTDVIASCKQKDDEPVADFLVRLTRVHTDHCGIDTPAQRAAGPGEVEEEEEELKTVPAGLWAQGKNDVGLIKGCEPVHITPKSDYRPHQHQYPLKPEAVEGIRPVFQSLKQAGVIVPCPDSPVRTPIFPVKKPGRDEWRFVQDLQAVNAAVHPRAPEVPNPHTILSQIPPDSEGSSSRGDEYATPHPPTSC